MSWHKQSEAKGRWRQSIVILLSITVASQLVGTGTQAAADATSPASTFDFVEGTATPEEAWAVGPYAASVIQARRQLGIVDQGEDLTQTQDDAVAALADTIVLNWLQTTTEPTLDDVNAILDNGGARSSTTSSSGYDSYAALNDEEKRACRWQAWDCWRARNASSDAFKWAAERYPAEGGHNDVRDALRHCVWSALMTKRANSGFAEDLGNAHEYGDTAQPTVERDMDLHNNGWGRAVGVEGENQSDRWIADRCQQLANDGSLRRLAVSRRPDITPEENVATPAPLCTAVWTVAVLQDPARVTTLRMDFGDGQYEDRNIPAGSGKSVVTFTHVFPATQWATYTQRATILETAEFDESTTTHA